MNDINDMSYRLLAVPVMLGGFILLYFAVNFAAKILDWIDRWMDRL